MQTDRAMLGSQRAVGGSGFGVWSLGVGFRVEGQFLKRTFLGPPKQPQQYSGNTIGICLPGSSHPCYLPTVFSEFPVLSGSN